MTGVIAAVLIHPMWTVPTAVVATISVAWYFRRLGRDDVPASRRRVRRLSLITVLAMLPLMVWVLSFVDPEQQPGLFIAIWSMVFVILLIAVALALLDMVNSFRLHHETVKAELDDAASELAKVMRKRRDMSERRNVRTPNNTGR